MRFTTYLHAVALGATFCRANDAAHGNQLCMAACQESYSYISFQDAPKSLDYYVIQCTTPLLLLSIFSCGQKYCTPDEITAGKDYLNRTCEFYGSISMPPIASILALRGWYDKESYVLSLSEFYVEKTFNTSVIPAKDLYDASYSTLSAWGFEMDTHDNYGWAMYGFWGGVILIGAMNNLWNIWCNYVYTNAQHPSHIHDPVPTVGSASRIHNWIMARLVHPATFGYRRAQPVGWCTIPPLLETLTIATFVSLNIILCAVNYRLFEGNLYWPDTNQQLWRYLSDRTGIIAFANFPLLWIFGTRNNFLMLLTGWDFATFTSFHRWVARVTTIEAILHSVGYTVETFLESGASGYYGSWVEQYWYTGAIATVAMALMLGFSVYGLRKSAYECFLVIHIGFAVIVLVGCFYHVKIFNGLYNGYLWACIAIWSFDRLLRLVRLGVLNLPYQYGRVSFSPEANIIRLDVNTNVSFTFTRGSYYFVYILHGRRFWESHPFTAVHYLPHFDNVSSAHDSEKQMLEKIDPVASSNDADGSITGRISFLIRPHQGFTARLRNLTHGALTGKPLRVLIEGPYGHQPRLGQYHNVLFVVGGSGITVAMASLQAALQDCQRGLIQPKFHLVWAMKDLALFEVVSTTIAEYRRSLDMDVCLYVTESHSRTKNSEPSSPDTAHIEASMYYEKLDVHSTVSAMAGNVGEPMAVVACGPPRLADDCRKATVAAARQFGNIDYLEERFAW